MPKPTAFTYRAFGLNIVSQIPITGFLQSTFITPDVTVQQGTVPENLELIINKGVLFQSNEHEFLLRIEGIASYYINNGKEIIIHPDPKAQVKDISAFLTGTCFGSVLHQRKQLPLHASTVIYDKKCLVFMGISGAGKSTLAAALIKKGATLVADDISVIDFSAQVAAVQPGFPAVKIWQDSLKHLDLSTEGLQNVREELKKYYLPIQQFSREPVPVDLLFVLNAHNKPDVQIKLLEGIDKFQAIKRHTYLFRGIPKTGLEQNHFLLAGQLVSHLPLYLLTRPDSHFNTDQLLGIIQSKLFPNG